YTASAAAVHLQVLISGESVQVWADGYRVGAAYGVPSPSIQRIGGASFSQNVTFSSLTAEESVADRVPPGGYIPWDGIVAFSVLVPLSSSSWSSRRSSRPALTRPGPSFVATGNVAEVRLVNVAMVIRPDAGLRPGGDVVQAEKTAEALRRTGVRVRLGSGEGMSDADVVHIFNLQTPAWTLAQVRAAQRLRKPIVLSPVYWNWHRLLLGAAAQF